jgi:uncharacterized Tic20 family protein
MSAEFRPWGMEQKTFLLLMHLSQLTNFIIPFGGLILPLVMWTTNKDKSTEIDQHGKVILNWVLSAIIYSVICFILTLVLIGALGFIILGIVNLVFIVIGAIKANEGVLWEYPASIKFFKL